jgi:hypothetical protein
MIPQTLSQARKLIDELRSKLLSKPSAQEVQKLGMSLTNGLDLTNATSMAEVAETVELFQEGRRRSGQPRNLELDRAARALGAPVKPAPAASAPPRPATTTATKAPARPAAARPAPAPSAPSPLADFSNAKLAWLVSHRSATEADRQTARAELRRRGATITASGIVSKSTRRQPK